MSGQISDVLKIVPGRSYVTAWSRREGHTATTWAEIQAYAIMEPNRASSNCSYTDIRAAADRLIMLAERIKAERASLAVQLSLNAGSDRAEMEAHIRGIR